MILGCRKISGVRIIWFLFACIFLRILSLIVRFTDEKTVEEPEDLETVYTLSPSPSSTPAPAELGEPDAVKIKTILDLDYPAHYYSPNKKYITFSWNSGRLNNQIRSLEASMAYAKYYRRSLVIPRPRRENEVTGIYYGLWDLHWLMKKLDFMLEPDMPDELVNLLGNPLQYTRFQDLPKGREVFNPEEACWVHKEIHDEIPENIQNDCKIVYLKESLFGVFRWDSRTNELSDYLKPAKYIRDAVNEFSRRHFPNGTMRIGVHNRAMKEGGIQDDIPYMCQWKGMSVFSARPDAQFMQNVVAQYTFGNSEQLARILHIYWASCAIKFDALREILEFHKKEPPSAEEKFFLGDDGTALEVLSDLKAHGAVVWEADEYFTISKAEQMAEMSRFVYGCNPCFESIIFENLERGILDMLTFTNVEFFVGSWMSTFTETVCRWRGIDRKTDSSLCFFKQRWRDAVKKRAKYK